MAPPVRGGHADIAHAPGFLVGEQRLEMPLPGQHIVDLHEVEPLDAPQRPRTVHLTGTQHGERRPDLGRREQRHVAQSLQPIADDRLRRAVHRRGIDHGPTGGEEFPQHLDPPVPPLPILADVEGDPRTHPDRGQQFARGRDGPQQQARRRHPVPAEQCRHPRTGGSPEHHAPVKLPPRCSIAPPAADDARYDPGSRRRLVESSRLFRRENQTSRHPFSAPSASPCR